MGLHHHHNAHSNSGDNEVLTSESRYRDTKKVTLVGAGINLFLTVIKIVFGYLGQSQSLIADGIHSLSDLLSDGLVLFAAKHSAKDADENHPYGHGRIETLVTIALGMLLIIVAGGMTIDAFRRIMEPDELLHPGVLALMVAFISIVANEFLYHYTIGYARKYKSRMLRANAWHHRSDAVSSVIVLLGVGGTLLGFHSLDAIAAIGVSLMIAKIGWELCVQSARELVDESVEPELVKTINDKILGVDGVRELHTLRTRRMGGDALVDVHVLVDPKVSVSEGHYIGEKVREQLIAEIDDITDVMVHIDPEDDEQVTPSDNLPERMETEKRLKNRWQSIPESTLIDNITLHYLDGKIHVEVTLPLEKMVSREKALEVSEMMIRAGKEEHDVADVKVLFH